MDYLYHVLIILTFYVILSTSLNLVTGYCALVSLCHAAFYGIGAYGSAILVHRFGIPLVIGGPIALAIAATLSLFISLPSFRLRGDYFILSSLGFQIVVYYAFYNLTGLTGGPAGIAGIDRPVLFGISVDSLPGFLFLSGVSALACVLLAWFIAEKSSLGRDMKAVRDDEVAAETLGVNRVKVRTLAFALSGAMAAAAGVLFAHYMSFVDPTSFSVGESIFLLSVVVIGGLGTTKGPIIGATAMILLPEVLQFLKIPDTVAPNVRQIIYGSALVALMFLRPQGLAGRYRLE